jgi:hypothetical protein
MSEAPVPRDPGRDEDPPGVSSDLVDHPLLGAAGWQLVPCSPDWPEWMDEARLADEYPGDLEEYQDPDNAPPAVDDAALRG